MNAKKSDRSFYICAGIVAYLAIFLLSVHMSIVSPKVPDDNILTIFQLALDRLTSKPLDIFPITSVSYTHLDVYKRQIFAIAGKMMQGF